MTEKKSKIAKKNKSETIDKNVKKKKKRRHITVRNKTKQKTLTGLGELAVRAEDEEFDVLVHELLEGGVGVGAVNDRAFVLLVVASLRATTNSQSKQKHTHAQKRRK